MNSINSTFTFNLIVTSVILLTTLPVQGMEPIEPSKKKTKSKLFKICFWRDVKSSEKEKPSLSDHSKKERIPLFEKYSEDAKSSEKEKPSLSESKKNEEEYRQIALQSERYNQAILPPQEILLQIFCNVFRINIIKKHFSYYPEYNEIYNPLTELLRSVIRNEIYLSRVCKQFNTLLATQNVLIYKYIGDLCKNSKNPYYAPNSYLLENCSENCTHLYSLREIDFALLDFISSRHRILIPALNHAGANIWRALCTLKLRDPYGYIYSVLKSTIQNNNMTSIEKCLKDKYDIDTKHLQFGFLFPLIWDPNELHKRTPLFFEKTPLLFFARTIEMAQLLVDNNVNIHARDKKERNVLWYILDTHPSELLQFYVDHHVDAITACPDTSLFHVLAEYRCITDINDFLKKGAILLDAIPHMIDIPNIFNQRPIDIAKASLQQAEQDGTPQAYRQLIALYEKQSNLNKEKNNETQKIDCSMQHNNTLTCYSFDSTT